MKKYFIYLNGKQSEALSFEELSELLIDKDTFIWYEGIENWQRAGELRELDDLWSNSNLENNTSEVTTSNINKWFVGGCLAIIIIIVGWYYFKSTTQITLKSLDKISENKTNNSFEKEQLELMENGCFHTDLSEKYNYRIMRNISKRYLEGIERDLSIVTVVIFRKASNEKIDVINFTSTDLYSNVFENCTDVRSFSTNKNVNNDVWDGDWGDLVIADFNSDTREDLAVKWRTGNAGAMYVFYLQNNEGKYIRELEHTGIEYRLNLKTVYGIQE